MDIAFRLSRRARAEANEILVVARNPVAFQNRFGRVAKVFGPYAGNLDNKGGTLRVKDRGPGYPATVDIVHYAGDGGWPREADGSGRTLEFDRREHVAKQRRGGKLASLGRGRRLARFRGRDRELQQPFLSRRYELGREDKSPPMLSRLSCTSSAAAAEPECRAASDLNGDGKIRLDDAIFLLRHLFLGAEDPIPFPGPGDCGFTTEEACSVSNCA